MSKPMPRTDVEVLPTEDPEFAADDLNGICEFVAYCGGCDEEFQRSVEDLSDENRYDASRRMHADGWRLGRFKNGVGTVNLCPECVQKAQGKEE